MKSLRGIAIAAALILTGTAASAVTTTYVTSAGDGDLGTSQTFSAPGTPVSLTVTGSADLFGKGSAIAVAGGGSSNFVSPGQSLTFTFSQDVELMSIETVVRGSGTQVYRVSNAAYSQDFVVDDNTPPSNSPALGTLMPFLTGAVFTLELITTAESEGDQGIRLRELTVSAIPLPPAILGVISAFGLAFGVRRATSKRGA